MRTAFLGYDRDRTSLIDALRERGLEVDPIADSIDDLGAYDWTVSFGYRHLLRAPVLATARRPVLNLHISYLPYNRGAHPNFWSLMEGTPSGVTIHEIDEGVDTGPIVLQEQVAFPAALKTFAATHAHLIERIETLFKANIETLIRGDYVARLQQGEGSLRRARELPGWMTDWEMEIADARRRFEAQEG